MWSAAAWGLVECSRTKDFIQKVWRDYVPKHWSYVGTIAGMTQEDVQGGKKGDRVGNVQWIELSGVRQLCVVRRILSSRYVDVLDYAA